MPPKTRRKAAMKKPSTKAVLDAANAIPCTTLFAGMSSAIQARQHLFMRKRYIFLFRLGPELSEQELEEAVDLMEAGVKQHLDGSSMGWSRTEKRDELSHAESHVVLVYLSPTSTSTSTSTPPSTPPPANTQPLAALLAIRFEHDDLDNPRSPPVLYCYEIHVHAAHRRAGLGRFLVDEMVRVGREQEMRKVMLTVMRANTSAISFYNAMQFETDESSPEDADYLILSRRLS